MKPYLLLLICCFALSCSKDESSKNDYRINGVSDVNTRQDTSINIGLAIVQETGAQEQVTLSITGLPDKVTPTFSSEKGTPDFASILTLKIGYAATVGTHAVKIKGVSASGVTKEYPFNLKIDAVGDCKEKLVGSYIKDPTDCNGNFGTTDATIKLTGGNKIEIGNFPGYGEKATATVDCESKKFTLDEITDSYYFINGTGTFMTNGIIDLDLQFKAIHPGPPEFNCKSKMVKK
jgi:hypothetical protein